ncbi:hypothetical protein KKHLCK_02605 [Candidatus Electrothrix laxa]
MYRKETVMNNVALGGIIFSLFCCMSTVSAATINPQYYQVNNVLTATGVELDEVIINGPPSPLPGFTRVTVKLPEPNKQLGVNTLEVPAFSWSFGCSATTASSIGQ